MNNGSLAERPCQPSESSPNQPVTHPSLDQEPPNVSEECDNGPPTKKQKIGESSIATKLHRPVSPPWKRVIADGPSSFVEGGRRKSSRTNAVPLDLQPQSATRQTRAAAHKREEVKGRPARNSCGVVREQPKTENAEKRPFSAGKASQRSAGKSTSWIEPKSPTLMRKHSWRTEPTPSKQQKPSSSKGVIPQKGASHLSHAKSTPKKSSSPEQHRYNSTSQRHTSPRTPTNPYSKHYQPRERDNGGSTHTSPMESGSRPGTLLRVKLRVRMPSIVVQSPANIPQPKRFSTFQDFLDKDTLEPKSGDHVLGNQQVEREADIRRRLDKAQQNNPNFEEELTQPLPEKYKDPRQYAHHDHLVAHVLHFRKLLHAEHQKHKANARRIAHEAAKAARAKIPRSQEDIEKGQYEENQAKYRHVAKDILRLWAAVESEVNSIRKSEMEAIEQKRQQERFHEQVEKHTQMLAPSNLNSRSTSEDEGGSVGGGEDEEDEDDNDADEDNMSSAESGESSTGDADDADAGLTAEELHQKYAQISTPSSVRSPVAIDDSMISPSPQVVEGATESTALEDVDAMLLDDDSDSIDTDDGEDTSDSEDDEDGDDDDEEEEEEEEDDDDKHKGLLSLLGLGGLKAEEERLQEADPVTDAYLNPPAQTRSGEQQSSPKIWPKAPNDNQIQPILRPTLEITTQDQNSIGVSTPASPRTSVSKVSEGDSFTSTDLRAESRQASTPVMMKSAHARTPVPSLLRGTLREYQHEGLDWLANLYRNNRNGILADEMGLGKTIQSIALLAHLAVEHHIWGPHLIIVPSSVLLNWEMEFKKFCPGLKVLTYYGSISERQQKRKGWMDDDRWNVIITSYQLVLQDQKNFKRRRWHYMILDEAHNIKNFRSNRWQTMLTFNTRARLLLTGTPLQNSLTELWSLLFFLRPSDIAEDEDDAFAGLDDFSQWTKRVSSQVLDHGRESMDQKSKESVTQLQKVIRPYLLRRLKADVEKQMPGKYEHIELCRLSKRQRQLYDGFLSLSKTKETLASGNYLSIINCLMQLRKVCNHPDLFETRPITTSFAMSKPVAAEFEIKDFLVRRKMVTGWDQGVSLDFLRLAPISNEGQSIIESLDATRLTAIPYMQSLPSLQKLHVLSQDPDRSSVVGALSSLEKNNKSLFTTELERHLYQAKFHTRGKSVFGQGLLRKLHINLHTQVAARQSGYSLPRLWEAEKPVTHLELVKTVRDRADSLDGMVQRFGCVTPAVVAMTLSKKVLSEEGVVALRQANLVTSPDPFHQARTRLSIAFPDKRLLQFDCGKLQRLDKLLRTLQAGGHRALIFTQMTKVLDILEQFLNIHGHRYLRLDGSTKIEQRQILTERFNNDTQFLAFILSSRSGGLGINLTGADTVIFYDLDWNPAMDKQCQDRCHRIGQTRDVHIYRFVSEHTIESNILRKSDQKRQLDDVVIQEGDFTTDYISRLSMDNILGSSAESGASAAIDQLLNSSAEGPSSSSQNPRVLNAALLAAEDKEDAVAAQAAEREGRHINDDGDFDEDPSKRQKEDQNSGYKYSINVGALDDWILGYMKEVLDEELGEVGEEAALVVREKGRTGGKKKGKKVAEHRIKRK